MIFYQTVYCGCGMVPLANKIHFQRVSCGYFQRNKAYNLPFRIFICAINRRLGDKNRSKAEKFTGVKTISSFFNISLRPFFREQPE